MTIESMIETERASMRDDGFTGAVAHVASEWAEAGHFMRLAFYRFPDGSRHAFVEAAEDHDGPRRARILPLTEVVHLLQNVGALEFWRITARDEPRSDAQPTDVDDSFASTLKSAQEALSKIGTGAFREEIVREGSRTYTVGALGKKGHCP